MAGDGANARRLMAWSETMPIMGRNDAAMRSVARGLLKADEGSVAEAMPDIRAGMTDLYEMEDEGNAALLGLAILSVLGPAVPEARAYAERSMKTLERIGVARLPDVIRASLDGTAAPSPEPTAANTAPAATPVA